MPIGFRVSGLGVGGDSWGHLGIIRRRTRFNDLCIRLIEKFEETLMAQILKSFDYNRTWAKK